MPDPNLALAPGGVRIAVVVLTLFNTLGAASGAYMLITQGLGSWPISQSRLAQLGFTSWAQGGIALVVAVCVPMLVAGVLVWAGHPWGGVVTLGAGLVLVCWIVVQVALIGLASWLQPTYFVVGVAVAAGGLLLVRAS